jgi:hypothetical protein
VTQVSPEMRRTLEAVAGNSLVEFADVTLNLNRNELLEQLFSHVESLRVQPVTSFPGVDD